MIDPCRIPQNKGFSAFKYTCFQHTFVSVLGDVWGPPCQTNSNWCLQKIAALKLGLRTNSIIWQALCLSEREKGTEAVCNYNFIVCEILHCYLLVSRLLVLFWCAPTRHASNSIFLSLKCLFFKHVHCHQLQRPLPFHTCIFCWYKNRALWTKQNLQLESLICGRIISFNP